jgi:hypothetical protein
MSSEAQISANRQNAQSSSGPTSEIGKSVSRLNAVKTGITGRLVLVSAADAPIYKTHIDRFFTKYTPANPDENDLVQSIADHHWRLLRIAPLEASVYALGRDKCLPLIAHEKDDDKREAALLGLIYLTFEKNLNNIALQERRLRKQIEKDTAKLEALQKERATNRQKEIGQAQKSIEICKLNNIEPDFQQIGFDFSRAELEAYIHQSRNFFALSGGKTLNFDTFLTAFRAEPNSEVA